MTVQAIPREQLLARINRLEKEETAAWGAQGRQAVGEVQERIDEARERALQQRRWWWPFGRRAATC
jgi:hypothetical protein